MKIKACVTEVSDVGDKMRVTGQGSAAGDAKWRPMLSMTIDLPITRRNQKAFYIGRSFEMKVKPV